LNVAQCSKNDRQYQQKCEGRHEGFLSNTGGPEGL
jgi:hypothetical protein